MGQKKCRYLSSRLLAAGTAAALLNTALLAALLWAAVLWILRPFCRLERNTRLFLEGCSSDNWDIFAERLQLTIQCDSGDREEIYNCRLPKLTMQPILENSIIHGTECKIGIGHLAIHLERVGKLLLIRISDDGVGMDEEALAQMNRRLQTSARSAFSPSTQEKGGIALLNVNNRIHLLFGEEHGLRAFSVSGVGTDVEITLPAMF